MRKGGSLPVKVRIVISISIRELSWDLECLYAMVVIVC